MDFTAVVLFKGLLAHYTVAIQKDGTYIAGLLKYSGNKLIGPPEKIFFRKAGRHCEGDTDEQELMDDICDAVQSKMTKQGMLGPGSNPNSHTVRIW